MPERRRSMPCFAKAIDGFCHHRRGETHHGRPLLQNPPKQIRQKTVEKLLWRLKSSYQLILLDDKRFITPWAITAIKDDLQRFIHQNGCFSMQDCQTVFGYGRSQAVAVLEYLDEIGFTIRQENIRILRE